MAILLLIIGAVLVLIFGKSFHNVAGSDRISDQTKRFKKTAIKTSAKVGIPYQIILAVIDQESSGDPKARGSAGEIGLMQLKQIAVQDLIENGFNVPKVVKSEPEANILQGASYLKLQHKRAKNWFDALRAYNKGYAGSKRNDSAGRRYAQEVLKKAESMGYHGKKQNE